MKKRLVFFALAWLSLAAQAELLKCVDSAGKVSYGEKALAGQHCSAVTATVNVVPATKPLPNPAPAPAPAATLNAREQLQNQIASQEAALAEAQKALADQESIRLGNEANYQRVLDRLQPYRDKVAEIQKNLDQLRSDLARLP